MRIARLHLERYGPFTDVELAFRPGAKLHVVYGPNEAGKSCALAAVEDLLFGIEERTTYNFLHDNRDMRIGAEISNGAGKVLRCRRRKGRKETLLDWETGAPLAGDALADFLRGVSRDMFRQAFGLNSATLRSGAEEMLKADGEVGTSLFAAASGLRGLTDLRGRLEAEAEAIFTGHKSSKRAFYQALDRYDEARKAVRDRELRSPKWKEVNDEIDRLAGEVEDIKRRQAEARTDHARLTRLGRVAPQIARIDDLVARLDGLSSLPSVRAGLPRELEGCLRVRDDAAREHQRAVDEEGRSRQALAAIETHEGVLSRAEEIEALVAELGAYTRVVKDMPGVEREIEILDGELSDLALRLGLPDAAALVKRRPADMALALVRELLAEGNRLADEQAHTARELIRVQNNLTSLAQRARSDGLPRDPRPFEERLEALKPALRRLERYGEQRAAAERLLRQLGDGIDRLSPAWPGNVEELAAADLPRAEAIASFARTFEDSNRHFERLKDQLDRADAARSDLVKQLASMAEDRPVPTVDAIAASRADRDAVWLRLHGILLAPPGTTAAAEIARAATDFVKAVTEADRLADEAIREATRVAEHVGLQRQLGARDDEIAKLSAEQQLLRQALAALQASYADQWRRAGIAEPLEAARMTRWLEAVDGVLELRRQAASARDALRDLDEAAAWAGPQIIALAEELDVERPGEMPLVDLAEAVRLKLRRLGEAWSSHREIEIEHKAMREQLGEHERRARDLASRQESWATRWGPAVQAIGLDTATLAEAEAALAVWQAVPGKLAERSNRASRVAAMRRHNQDYAAKVAALVGAEMPDLATRPTEDAIRRASTRLANVREQAARRADAEQRQKAAEKARAVARSALEAAEAALAALAGQLPPTDDMAALCRELALREDVAAQLAQQRLQLAEQADGMAEAELRTQLAGRDPDRASADVTELEELQARLEDERSEKFAAWRAALAKREALEQGTGAEEAAQQQRSAEADLAMHSRDWCVLKIGAMLLGAAIERQRSSHNDPLMARAGELFTLLSAGSFSGLTQELDDQDVPRLVGRRPSEASVHVKAMSEGARDQLYLALRLAYLEDFASRSEPPPFIGDDLFMTFDDDRARSGLLALAGLSETLQPIIFTHHRHLVDIAREALGDGLDELRLG